MREYKTNEIRNVAILGHLGSGKTSLTESLLFIGEAIEKKGEVEKKNTVSDYMLEEQIKQSTISSSLIPVEWNNNKINFIDTPGNEEFIGEIDNILSVVKGAVLIIDASKGVEVGTERSWEELRKRNIPTLIYINKMDKENIKFDILFEEIRTKLGKHVVPFCYPLGKEDKFDGIALVVEHKARIYKDNNCVDAEIYEDKLDKVQELYEKICESVAETSMELMDKYFSGEPLTLDEVKHGLRTGVLCGDIYPVICGSTLKNIGIHTLLNMMIDYMPTPNDLKAKNGINPDTKEQTTRVSKIDEPLSGYVFKTIVDPFVGTINLFKLYSGTIKTGQEVFIPNINTSVKMTQLFSLMGKTQLPLDTVYAGDIVAVAKIPELVTGYTFCDKKSPVLFEMPEYPTPTIYVAIKPKQKADEEKISLALQKIAQEDQTFEIKRNHETAQLLIGGQGLTHIGYVIDKLKNTFKVEVDIEDPKVVYRETIKGKTDQHGVQGRHKKQSGGAGQFGDVWIRFEPSNEEFEFSEEVFGGAVPKNYFPAVEKGLRKALEKGPLSGCPVIGVKATLTDGSYHPVDSNEISFVLAAGLAWQEACKIVKPTILEPIVELQVIIKSDYVGTIMGDMSKRRGRILGQEELENGKSLITAEVPESEILKYAIDLKAMTQASGRFMRKFLRYDPVPEFLVNKIMEDAKKK